MLPLHLKATLILTMFALCAALSLAEQPQAPTFLRAPSFLTTGDDVRVELQIVPHAEIRYVVLEAWQADVDTQFDVWQRAMLVRGSLTPVNEKNRTQKTFPFEWYPFDEGSYLLVAKVTLPRGITRESEHRLRVD